MIKSFQYARYMNLCRDREDKMIMFPTALHQLWKLGQAEDAQF